MKLDHVQLAMPPGEESTARAYFVNVLGMEEEQKPYPLSDRGGCWFRCDEAIVHIGVDVSFAPQKKAHPAFLMKDLLETAEQLQQAGYPVVWDKTLERQHRFYSVDPFGNRIEFIADGDGFSQQQATS